MRSGERPLALELLPAVEINSVATGIDRLWEGELHILGLGVDPSDDAFEATLERQRHGRTHRFELMLERLRVLGLGVDAYLRRRPGGADVALGRPTIARALVAAGHASSVDDAMRRLLARGRPAYVQRQGSGRARQSRPSRRPAGCPRSLISPTPATVWIWFAS